MGTITTKDLINAAARREVEARKLREAAEILGYTNSTSQVVKHEKQASRAKPFNGTRAEQLKDYLHGKHGGGATRQEILAESGIPAGTVASLLGFSKKFIKDRHDHWHIRGTAYLRQQAEAVKAQPDTQAAERQPEQLAAQTA